jgi:two-component system sensor histidine kinase CpxA
MKAGRSLFATIFLWFLGGMLAMVLVGIGLTIFMTRQGIILTGREDIIADALSNHGIRSVDIYEEKGSEALREHLDEIRHQSRLSIHVFDAEGKSLAPGPMDERVLEIVEYAKLSGETTIHKRKTLFMIQERISEGGSPYTLVAVLPKRPLFPDLTRNKPALFIHLTGLFFTIVLISWFLARHLARPIGELNKAAMAIAEGDFSVRVGDRLKKRSDEIGQLGRSFDVMARHINELLDAQNRLIRDISHELRSPLARLVVALELARKRSKEEAKLALDRIEVEAERLGELTGQLLSIARLDADMGRVRMTLSDLRAFLQGIVEDAGFEASHEGKKVRLQSETEACFIAFNEEMLRSALENVIRNAVRHTPLGEPVEVRLRETGDNVVISVRDYGPGVPEESLPDIFRPFYRIDEARDRGSGGVGLGLAIAQRAVVLHGGKITAANAVDGGLEVSIFLPLRRQV